jgi:hypothetical protein
VGTPLPFFKVGRVFIQLGIQLGDFPITEEEEEEIYLHAEH